MKGKPIEPGCLAMIVGSKGCPENNGKVVRVVRRIHNGEKDPNGFRVISKNKDAIFWLVEALSAELVLNFNRGGGARVRSRAVAQFLLIRLDDGEEPKTVSTAHTKDLDQVI
jgi:hypothetical protein